jgi:hypothetical protein
MTRPKHDAIAAPDEVPSVDANTVGIGVKKIPTVIIGDSDGWAAFVMRSLGFGDAAEYDWAAAACVSEIQEAAGLTSDGCVDGLTWAHVLPEIGVTSHDVMALGVLRLLLDMPFAGDWTEDVSSALESRDLDPALVGVPSWVALLS